MSKINPEIVPDITEEYFELISEMVQFPGLYGMDDLRILIHDTLCKFYGLSKEQTKIVTDNLDKYSDAISVHKALINLIKD